MEMTGLIGILVILGITMYYLIELRKISQRERKERLANAERKRMIQRQITLAEGKIQWD